MEFEANVIALLLMASAGYNPVMAIEAYVKLRNYFDDGNTVMVDPSFHV
ncbi:hypothetical protein OROHE_016148 [Orobanche hederae]